MCTTLYCRPNTTSSTCNFIRGFGAASGTPCDKRKVHFLFFLKLLFFLYKMINFSDIKACAHGMCTKSIRAPKSGCVFGDDMVTNQQVIDEPLPEPQLTCRETIKYLSSINLFGPAYCAQPRFRQACCKTCESE